VISFPDIQLSVLVPIALVAIGAMLVLMGEVTLSRMKVFLGRQVTESFIGTALAITAIVFLGLALLVTGMAFASGGVEIFNPDHSMYQLDPFSLLMTGVVLLSALLSCALSVTYLAEMRINHGEYYALVMLSTTGMMLMIAAIDLITVFLGLEMMSIPIYVLAGFDRRKLRSNESALKYFLIGSFASAIMLYGMALLYGATGSTSFEGIRAGFDAGNSMGMIGLGLIVVGFAFKISSVPFHQWTPDVYEGAPAAVTAFMSVTVKVTAFAALIRMLGMVFSPLDETLIGILWMLSFLTMIVGNLMAVIQENVKRLLAYSSIAHAGYLLIGLVTGTIEGYSAMVFYLIAYTFMTLGAFAVVVALANRGSDCERMESFAGLAQTRPGLAALMTLFMISLAGIPGTAGFMGKFHIFMAAVEVGEIWLLVVGVMMSVVSVYYYLRVPVLMYMHEPNDHPRRTDISSGESLVLIFCAFAVIILGLFPNEVPTLLFDDLHVLDWARSSVRMFFGS
jgi:NADH-quinone oxidoreductase subunit N